MVSRSSFNCGVLTLASLASCLSAHAQRAEENAVAEATDAFGTTVGREEIGLYSPSNARGLSPSDAGNLRIDGLYFDQIHRAEPVSRIVRGSSVHVGISAQGFPFPAPTGVVDFHLRTPGEEAAGGALLGLASYGQVYAELDVQTPVVADVLSVGGGVGYARNSNHNYAELTDEWTVGAIAHWQPIPSLTLTPFWSTQRFVEREEKPAIFIGSSGYPKYRAVDVQSQPWADYGMSFDNVGTTARLALGTDWELALGAFRSQSQSDLNYQSFLLNTDSEGRGDYFISASPARLDRSTSGELRLSRRFSAEAAHHTLYMNVKGRRRTGDAGGAHTIFIGTASTKAVPIIEMPQFHPTPTTLIEATEYTPGLAYEGVWRDVGQLSLGVQKTFYDRTVTAPERAAVSDNSSPWLYNAGAAVYVTKTLVVYASATRGFEEIGIAPVNAANRDEAVPAQMTEQIDAGIKYQLTPRLQLVAGVFEIDKPYFDLDEVNVYRRVGTRSNRGFELSLAGDLTDRFTVVAGVILIDPQVEYDADGDGTRSEDAIGPVPGLVRANFQYRVANIPDLTFDAKIEYLSERYARADSIRLPAVTTIDVGLRYSTEIFGRAATVRLQGLNLTNEYGLEPEASGRLSAFESRRFDLSLALDF